jgi:TRAP-type uncharacterized transport system fused permease subunit
LPLVIFMVFLMGLVLGMGLPIVGSYLILATVAGPAMSTYGLHVLAVHLMILWYCETAAVTPPVCLATFVACGIAGSKLVPTALHAMWLVAGMYVMPLLFIYTPLISGAPEQRLIVFAFSAVGFVCWSVMTVGYFKGRLSVPIRIAGLLVTPLFFLNFLFLKIAAVTIFAAFILMRYIKPKPMETEKS